MLNSLLPIIKINPNTLKHTNTVVYSLLGLITLDGLVLIYKTNKE